MDIGIIREDARGEILHGEGVGSQVLRRGSILHLDIVATLYRSGGGRNMGHRELTGALVDFDGVVDDPSSHVLRSEDLVEFGHGLVRRGDDLLDGFWDGHAALEELEGVDLSAESVDLARGEYNRRWWRVGEGLCGERTRGERVAIDGWCAVHARCRTTVAIDGLLVV